MATPTAAEIIERVKTRYAACRTYEDSGEQTTRYDYDEPDASHHPHTARLKFRTAFERGGRFFFEYRSSRVVEDAPWTHGVVWSDGKRVQRYWSTSPEFHTKDDLDHTLGAFQGVSSRTSSEIPALLIRGTKLHSRIATLGAGGVWPSDEFDGTWCVRVAGRWPEQGTRLAVWIEGATGLIRRTDESHTFTAEAQRKMHEETVQWLKAEEKDPARRASMLERISGTEGWKQHAAFTTKTTTIWRPRMDHDIDPRVFEFTPPQRA